MTGVQTCALPISCAACQRRKSDFEWYRFCFSPCWMRKRIIKAQVYFLIHMKYVVFMSLWPDTIKILISNWPRTRKCSHFFNNNGGEDVSYHGHALVTFYVQFLCSDCSKLDRWVHEENLCSILKLVYFDSWSWQSFMSTCDVFNCLFPLDVQNEIQLLSRVFCHSWFVIGFLVVKCVAWIREGFNIYEP